MPIVRPAIFHCPTKSTTPIKPIKKVWKKKIDLTDVCKDAAVSAAS